jgi:hypothetical protein
MISKLDILLNDEYVKKLIELGFVSSTFTRNVSICQRYLQYREQGKPSTDAVVNAADDFCLSDSSVYKILNTFSKIII